MYRVINCTAQQQMEITMTDLGKKSAAIVKVSRSVLVNNIELQGLVSNVQELVEDGWSVVLVHGAIDEELNNAPAKATKAGLQSNNVNASLVCALQAKGIDAFGCHGVSGKLIQTKPANKLSDRHTLPEAQEIQSINTKIIQNLLYSNLIPVIHTLGIDSNGNMVNVRTDSAVVEIARALHADMVLLTTSIGAIYRDLNDPGSRIRELTRTQALQLIHNGTISGDMGPKVEEAVSLLDMSVETVAVVSTREPGAFLDVIEDCGRAGTRIVM